MPMTEEAREYSRVRYAVRCQDEAYREKVREWGRDNYQRKKERLLDAGQVPKPRGRPRKYPTDTQLVEAALLAAREQ